MALSLVDDLYLRMLADAVVAASVLKTSLSCGAGAVYLIG